MNGISMWRNQASVYQLKHVAFSLNWICLHYRWHRHNITADLHFCKWHLTDQPLTNVQTFYKCTFLNITECTSLWRLQRPLISTELLCNLYSNMSAFCARFSEQVLVSFPHSGGSRPSPWEPSSSSEDSLSGTRAGSSWPSTLTLLDSIMPVLAWNLTVFNLARSFFSTLGEEKKKIGK